MLSASKRVKLTAHFPPDYLKQVRNNLFLYLNGYLFLDFFVDRLVSEKRYYEDVIALSLDEVDWAQMDPLKKLLESYRTDPRIRDDIPSFLPALLILIEDANAKAHQSAKISVGGVGEGIIGFYMTEELANEVFRLGLDRLERLSQIQIPPEMNIREIRTMLVDTAHAFLATAMEHAPDAMVGPHEKTSKYGEVGAAVTILEKYGRLNAYTSFIKLVERKVAEGRSQQQSTTIKEQKVGPGTGNKGPNFP